MRDDFAIFILSHGRADNMKTMNMLRKVGYTGKWYIVCDNEDDTLPEYQKKFGRDKILVFDKLAMSKRMDEGINTADRRAVCYARNVCFDLAKQLGLEYFLELDDDYTGIEHRYTDDGVVLKVKQLPEVFDSVCESFVHFLETTNVATIAMGQNGDLIGGAKSKRFRERFIRKAMNSFFCKTDRRFWFSGKSNEDVSTYVTLSNRGVLFFSYLGLTLKVQQTQSLDGGMSGFYGENSGYIKPFSSVIFAPQAIKIATMGNTHHRLHHKIDWNLCAPKILNEKWKKH